MSALWLEANWPRAMAMFTLSAALASCSRIAGIDDYTIGRGEAPTNPCGPNAVPLAGGECETVGVTACPNGANPDEGGGCPAVLTPVPCDPANPFTPGGETFGSEACGTVRCAPSPPPIGGASAVHHVNGELAGADADGSEKKPWKTIQEALNHVAVDGTAILIEKGEYREDLIVQGWRGVELIGTCPEEVSIRGTGDRAPPTGWPCGSDGPKAALCVASTAPETVIQRLTVTGGGDGVAIVGATGVKLERVAAINTERYGVRIEELWRSRNAAPLPASASLTNVSVRRAAGAGLYVAGATVEKAQDLLVAEVRQRNGYLGYGVSVRPGAKQIERPTLSTVNLSHALLIGNEDAALHVAGSSVTVDDSFLGNLETVDPKGRGVLVEREIPRGSDAHVTLRRSIVQRTRDAAIDVQSAALTLEDVTIRDTAGRKLDGCSGQGIRARTDRTTPVVIDVSHSLVEYSRQAAIHAHGARVRLEQSILRGSAPADAAAICAPHLGDGVTLHSLAGSPAELTLDRSIVHGNARAAIAAFDGNVAEAGRARVSITDSVLSCNRWELVATNDPPGDRQGALCGCGSGWHSCALAHEPLQPWVSRASAADTA